MAKTAKGAAARLVFDWEDTFATARTGANRRPRILAMNSTDIVMDRSLSAPGTLRSDRNPTDPIQGFKDVKGSVVLPVDLDNLGFWLTATVGTPTTVEAPLSASGSPAGSDIKTGGTVTIAAAGAATFSQAQTNIAVGDRVLYTDPTTGALMTAYVTAKTTDSAVTLQTTRTGGVASAVVTAATVVAVCDGLANATPGNVSTDASGVATFTAVHTGLVAGNMFIYDGAAPKIGFVSKVLTTTTANVVGADGFPIISLSAKTLEWIGLPSFFTHTFKVTGIDALKSFTLSKEFPDLATPVGYLYTGCKSGSMEITFGGDGELTANFGVTGVDETKLTGATFPYAVAPSPTALSLFVQRFLMSQATAEEGGVATTKLEEFSLKFDNGLDGDTYTIGGGFARGDVPEGDAQIGGSITALFQDTAIADKAANNTPTSLKLSLTSGNYVLSFFMPEVKFQPKSPAVDGPKGVRLKLDFLAYYSNLANNANGTALVVTFTTDRASFL